MLNDEPRPEDLPERAPSPYAALPPELANRAPAPEETKGPDGPIGSTVRKSVAVVAIIAVLAATLFAVWGALRASEPVAGDAWTSIGSSPSAVPTSDSPRPTPSATPSAPGAAGAD